MECHPENAFYGAHASTYDQVGPAILSLLYAVYKITLDDGCRYGPLVRHWTMRYEAKHAYFKTLAQSMGNFINVPFSLAMRHQQLQCYNSCSQEQVSLTVGPGKHNNLFMVFIILSELIIHTRFCCSCSNGGSRIGYAGYNCI